MPAVESGHLQMPGGGGWAGQPFGPAVAAAAAAGSGMALVALLLLCAKKEKKPVAVPANNSADNFKFNDPARGAPISANVTIYDDAPTPAPGVGGAAASPSKLKTKDWTAGLDNQAVGGARSVKKVKKKAKNKAADVFDGFDGKGGADAPDNLGGDSSLAAVNPVNPVNSLERKGSKYDGFGGSDGEELDGFGPTAPAVIGAAEDGYDTMATGFPAEDGRVRAQTMAVALDTAEVEEAEEIPAWYAGKLSRALCEEAVTGAGDGDFLVRESSRGDRVVICINDSGTAVNLVVQVTPDGKYRFAGAARESLHDVIFFLRWKPMTAGADQHQVRLSKPAPKDVAIAKEQQQLGALQVDLLQSGHQFSGAGGGGVIPEDDGGNLVIGAAGEDMYDSVVIIDGKPVAAPAAPARPLDPFVDPATGEEPLYVDMSDANVPSFNFIAEREEEHRIEAAGHKRISNDEFSQIRREALERAEQAAAVNRKLQMQGSVRRAWRNMPSVSAQDKPGLGLPQRSTEEENFASYEDASMREFGGYNEEEIYESVPRWFAGRLDRKKCEAIIRSAQNGTYVVRESSSGDKYIICLKHTNLVKNFQVYIRGPSQFEFSGRKYPTLDAVLKKCTTTGIMKNGERIPLTKIANW